MIKHIVSDFSHVILDAIRPDPTMGINKRYQILKNDPEVRKVLEPIFTNIFSGAEFNLDKTTPEAYAFITDELQLKPSEILYIDDQNANITAANEAGMQAIQYTNVEQLKKDLSKLGILS